MCVVLGVGAYAGERKKLSAQFGYSTFYLPSENTPYVETYLDFRAWTLNFVPSGDDQYRATVEITIVVRNGDSVVYLNKRDLLSPATGSDTSTDFTFMDLHRFALGNGIYDLQLILRDKASSDTPYVHNDKLIVFFEKQKTTMSNIQLMRSATATTQENMLSRNGYDMVPYIDDFVPQSVSALHPYFEIYNLDRELGDRGCTINLFLTKKETGRRIPGFQSTLTRSSAKSNIPVYGSIDIGLLPSGNYNLVVEVCDNDGQALLRRELSFMRSNPNAPTNLAVTPDEVAASFAARLTDKGQLDFYLDALYPIASPQEVALAAKAASDSSLAEKQSFFYHFWHRRNAMDPEGEWQEYRALLDYVTKHFSYPKTPGHQTDRGRVYLQYGPPDHIRDEKNFVGTRHMTNINKDSEFAPGGDPQQTQGPIHYLPYQLWRYNQLPNDYPDRVFLFWDQFRSGYYKLLNSNARGEVQTAKWERDLSQRQLDEDLVGDVGIQFERGY